MSMFSAALIFSCPNVELSIYSTCRLVSHTTSDWFPTLPLTYPPSRRISQKLLRNVVKFLDLIYEGLNVPRFPIIRKNMEEMAIHGPESSQDVRIVNSYPSKVRPSAVSRAPGLR